MRAQVNIQNLIIDSIELINNLQESLQKEFEWFGGSVELNLKDSAQEKKIRAKKNQQNLLSEIKENNKKLNDQIDILNENIFNLEACLLNYGVTPDEIIFFINKSSKSIENDIKNFIYKNIFQVPVNFASMVDWPAEQAKLLEQLNSDLDKIAERKLKPQPQALRFAQKPVLDWQEYNNLKS